MSINVKSKVIDFEVRGFYRTKNMNNYLREKFLKDNGGDIDRRIMSAIKTRLQLVGEDVSVTKIGGRDFKFNIRNVEQLNNILTNAVAHDALDTITRMQLGEFLKAEKQTDGHENRL